MGRTFPLPMATPEEEEDVDGVEVDEIGGERVEEDVGGREEPSNSSSVISII